MKELLYKDKVWYYEYKLLVDSTGYDDCYYGDDNWVEAVVDLYDKNGDLIDEFNIEVDGDVYIKDVIEIIDDNEL